MLRRLLRRIARGAHAPRARKGKTKPYHRIVEAAAAHRSAVAPRTFRANGRVYKEYAVALPGAYSARQISVRLSVPAMPGWNRCEFAEHVMDAGGRATDTVVARAVGAFAVSNDLGKTWRRVPLKGYRGRRFVHVKMLSADRFLAQAEPLRDLRDRPFAVDLLLLDADGQILASAPNLAIPWHGCRAVDVHNGVIMFAEYSPNAGKVGRTASRVFRSRDCGLTWQAVFEQTGEQIRHFHFLQVRPNSNEWWLTSGDAPDECRIWISNDDGDTWRDITDLGSGKISCGEMKFSRDLFRLTDLAWLGDEVIWGTDDLLWDVRKGEPGARIFRSRIGNTLEPMPFAHGKWHFRSFVDVGDSYIAISQGCPEPEAIAPADARPGVYLVTKQSLDGGAGPVHLFDVETYSRRRTGFTYASASRTAKDGTFFSFRGTHDVFPRGHSMLEWNVTFS